MPGWYVRDKLWPMPISMFECCFTSIETIRLIRTGRPGWLLNSRWEDDDDDVELHALGCRVDTLGTNCDQCVCTVQCCFTSTKTIRLIRTGSPGRPPGLSHSSWTLWGADFWGFCLLYISCCVLTSEWRYYTAFILVYLSRFNTLGLKIFLRVGYSVTVP